MSRNGILIAIGGVLAALLWTLAMWQTGDEAQPDPLADLPAVDDAPLTSARAEREPPPAAPAPAEQEPESPEPEAESPKPAQPAAAPEQEPPVGTEPPIPFGAIDELKGQYDREPRPSSARELEARMETLFQNPNIKTGLIDSQICHESICKVSMRWAPDHVLGYMAVYTLLVLEVGEQIAVDAATSDAPDGTRPVTLYVRRKAEAGAQK